MEIIGTIKQAPVAAFILLATVATSLFAFRDKSLEARFIFNPWIVVREKEYFRTITSGLIHANFIHLFFNTAVFLQIGFIVEHDMLLREAQNFVDMDVPSWLYAVIAHGKYAVLYLASMIVSHLSTLVKEKDNPAYNSLGASGAISGLLMAFCMFHPMGYSFFGIPAGLFGLVYMAGSILIGRIRWSEEQKATNFFARINHDAHGFGALGGAIFLLMLYPSQGVMLFNLIKSLLLN
ncbi:MAG: rhomboid family intramembrane serine protease [Bacteroidia bacterium]|nr:rhomboid family intramembrane serine protease [Bacteroidia bacterium]